MERKNKDFYILRAVDVTVVFLILLFLGLFTKVIVSVMNVFQSEVYTDMIANVSSM